MDLTKSQLRSGDILILLKHEQENGIHVPHHTAVVGPNNKFVVHADGDDLVRHSIKMLSYYTNHQPYIYRVDDNEWAIEAAKVAFSFAPKDNTTTVYGQNRARGVKQQLKTGVIPPYEFDALYRSLKWAKKSGAGGAFSVNRGATCSAFASACYHAGRMIQAAGRNAARIEVANNWIRGLRVDKGATKEARRQGVDWVKRGPMQWRAYPNSYKRERSNVGVKAGVGTLDEIWQGLCERLTGINNVMVPTFQQFLPGMCFDAKFIYTTTLKEQLDAANNNWACHRLIDLDVDYPANPAEAYIDPATLPPPPPPPAAAAP